MISRRSAISATIVFILLFAIYHISGPITERISDAKYVIHAEDGKLQEVPATKLESTKADTVAQGSTMSPLSPQVLNYFDQAFSVDEPAQYDFNALRQQCERTKWQSEDVYLECGGMSAGLTSIMSQVKVCLKMAVEAGTSLVLPSMPLRDSTNLLEFNFMNGDAYMTYEKWFDAEHLIEQLGRACPQMQIVYPYQLDSSVSVKNRWSIDIGSAPGYQLFHSYFWTGRPFRAFFEEQYTKLQQLASLAPDKDDTKNGITVISISSLFLLFRITDDPTGQDLKLWNELSHLIRFKEVPRKIVNELLSLVNRSFYGVHFRVESDTIWSSLENQLSVDLDALDKAWAIYGNLSLQKPLVYLACGDQGQVEKFVSAGKARGWEVTHKWQLAQSNAETLAAINDLPFDFQGAVDMGVMLKSHFFLGITGSAFSSTIGNARDVTGRYRGSSFTVYDDGNARTHLFNDNDAAAYACCL